MKKTSFLVILTLALFLASCSGNANNSELKNSDSSLNKKTYKNMTVDELNSQMKSKDFFLVDTHIPEQRHIEGTDAFISFEEIENRLLELPSDKDSKIVLYCRSGRMSEIAAEKLIELGYTDVYNVKGGINEWIEKGYELEKE